MGSEPAWCSGVTIKSLQAQLSAATARAEKAEAEAAKWRGLYEKAWAENQEWRRRYDAAQLKGPPGIPFGLVNRIAQERAHDAARKEAGLC